MIDFEIVAPLELQSGGGSVVGVWHFVCNRRLSLQIPKGRLVWSWMFRRYSCSMTLVAVLLVGLLSQLTKSKWFCQLRRIHELTVSTRIFRYYLFSFNLHLQFCQTSLLKPAILLHDTLYWAKDMEKHSYMRTEMHFQLNNGRYFVILWCHSIGSLIAGD